MKIQSKSLAIICLAFSLSSCDKLNQVASNLVLPQSSSGSQNTLSNQEVISGLKSALEVGISNATQLSSKTDGFLKNPLIVIPFPQDAIKVKEKAIEWGLTSQVNQIETTLNRAAEEASKQALPIFMDAIRNMSIQDGFAILRGGEGAASNFLKRATSSQLQAAFKPSVQRAIEQVELTKYWNPVVTRYNQSTLLTGAERVNPDLENYVTERAIEGLFTMVALEENKIRKDPAARVNDILKRVFGSLD